MNDYVFLLNYRRCRIKRSDFLLKTMKCRQFHFLQTCVSTSLVSRQMGNLNFMRQTCVMQVVMHRKFL
jgi:hypothetical protein